MAILDYDKNEPNNKYILLSVLATIILLVGIFIFSYFLYIDFLSDEQNFKITIVKTPLLDKLEKNYETNLNQLNYVDDSQKFVKVPINFGIEYVVDYYNK